MFHPRDNTLFEFFNDKLSPHKSLKVSRHLEKCSSCKGKVKALKVVDYVLIPSRPIPEDMGDNLLLALPDMKKSSQPICGEVVNILGDVTIQQTDFAEENVFPGMGIRNGDILNVPENGLVLIQLNDGSELYLNKNTKIEFRPEESYLKILLGTLFAMLKPQQKPFGIQTPSAFLEVLGTDFQTEVTEDNKTVLKVIKGKVSYKNESGKVLVKRKQQVSAEKKLIPETSRIVNIKQITDWTKPIVKKPIGKGSITKKLLAILAILIIGIFGFLFLKEKGSKEAHTSTQEILNPNEPYKLKSTLHKPGAKWRIYSSTKSPQNVNPIIEINIIALAEIISYDDNTGYLIRYTFEECKMSETSYMSRLVDSIKGRIFEAQFSSQGILLSINAVDGKPITVESLNCWSMCALPCDVALMYMKKRVSPGETWNRDENFAIPGFDKSFIRFNINTQFNRYEIVDGKKVAVFIEKFNGTVGGIYNKIQEHPKMQSVEYLNSYSLEGEAENLLDIETGRCLKTIGNSRTKDISATIYRYAKGRTQPLVENVNRPEGDRSESTIIYEYLQ